MTLFRLEEPMCRRLKIVVADDERDTREYLHELLTHLGHEVRVAGDGRQLVEMCREFAPDLIVTDYAMPGQNGLAAVAEVHRGRPVPVILFSGRHDIELPDRAEGSPALLFLAKPFKEAELRAAIESAVPQSEASFAASPR
jgi:two-component system OmpR family response regulator